MAITPRDNEAFYREVDEELRRDQLSKRWQRHGKLIIAGAVLVLAAIGGFIYWQNRKQEIAGERGETMSATLRQVQAGNTKSAAPKLDDLVASGGPGYRAIAQLTKADIALQAGDDKSALATLTALSEDTSIAEPFRQLALIRRTAMEFDRLPPTEVISRLQPLAMAGSAWFGSAGEMVALAHLKLGQPKQAAPIFAALARDETVPSSIRTRAVQMAGSLGVDATQVAGKSAPVKEVSE